MVGRATLTIELSSTIINWAAEITARARPRCLPTVFLAADARAFMSDIRSPGRLLGAGIGAWQIAERCGGQREDDVLHDPLSKPGLGPGAHGQQVVQRERREQQ